MTTPQDPFGPPSDPSRPSSPWGTPPGGDTPAADPGGQQGFGGQGFGPPPGQQGFGQPPGQPAWGSPSGGPKRNGLGVAALVVGVLALLGTFTVVGGIVLGIVAIVLGVLGRGRAKRGEADNGGIAFAGIVLGALALVVSAIFVAVGVAFFSSDTGRGLIDCVNEAGQDQAAIDACERQFAEELGQ